MGILLSKVELGKESLILLVLPTVILLTMGLNKLFVGYNNLPPDEAFSLIKKFQLSPPPTLISLSKIRWTIIIAIDNFII